MSMVSSAAASSSATLDFFVFGAGFFAGFSWTAVFLTDFCFFSDTGDASSGALRLPLVAGLSAFGVPLGFLTSVKAMKS
ncbi:hypothetical protein BGZ63DRAFT_394533 [Mariannaea sp. PMI_226]|nr:hypothetical protein BGZ63DRAFT_394533 [Mariannaea sp. PMI_226]